MKEALNLALEYVERNCPALVFKAIKEALAQPVQGPVANCWQTSAGEFHNFSPMRAAAASEAACKRMMQTFHKLYTTQPKREWVGLTAADSMEFATAQLDKENLMYAVEDKLKEKNT